MHRLDFPAELVCVCLTFVIKFKKIRGQIGALLTSISIQTLVQKKYEKRMLKSPIMLRKTEPFSPIYLKTTPNGNIRQPDTYV